MAPDASSRSARHSRPQVPRKSIIVETPIIDIPIDVRNSNYEEWMKMAMDNVSPFGFHALLLAYVCGF
jgi:hypothetical protein